MRLFYGAQTYQEKLGLCSPKCQEYLAKRKALKLDLQLPK